MVIHLKYHIYSGHSFVHVASRICVWFLLCISDCCAHHGWWVVPMVVRGQGSRPPTRLVDVALTKVAHTLLAACIII